MKKIFIFIFIASLFGILTGCGVKTDLEKPNPNYPRNYPVY